MLWASVAACAAMLLGGLFLIMPQTNTSTMSYVYVDGKKQKDKNEISIQALHSLLALEEHVDDDILESQIDFLDSFIDTE